MQELHNRWNGKIVGKGEMKEQMRHAYVCIARLLERYGATMQNVVDETLFAPHMTAAAVAAMDVRKSAYGGAFEVASALIGVASLASPDLMIEIKCCAEI